MTQCPACRLPPPNDWCWEGRWDCPLDMPPRHIDTLGLYRHHRALEKRVARLEEAGGHDAARHRVEPGKETSI